MIWFIIISLLLIGLILLVVEIIFIPGTTVVGILGLIFSIIGVTMTFNHFGDRIGLYVLLFTLLSTGVALYYSFKSGAWNKFALKTSIKSKVNEGDNDVLSVGDEGITISALRPSGKAEFRQKIYEVRSLGNYVEPNSTVKILEVNASQIIVEKLTI